MSIAVSLKTMPGPFARRAAARYFSATTDLGADERLFISPSAATIARNAVRCAVDADLNFCSFALAQASGIKLDPGSLGNGVRHVHCNHYFNAPLGRFIADAFGVGMAVETHDVQSRQYELSGAVAPGRRRKPSLEAMLKSELSALSLADTLIHLNRDEFAFFKENLPEQSHHLVYPFIPPVSFRPSALVVSSGNHANYLGIRWLLENIVPAMPEIEFVIVGDVVREFDAADPLFARNRTLFRGRVPDLAGAYAAADMILLPTVNGHGIGIKTIEAFSTGKPIIALPQAFRGFTPPNDPLVMIAEDCGAFRSGIRAVVEKRNAPPPLAAYTNMFSEAAYGVAMTSALREVIALN